MECSLAEGGKHGIPHSWGPQAACCMRTKKYLNDASWQRSVGESQRPWRLFLFSFLGPIEGKKVAGELVNVGPKAGSVASDHEDEAGERLDERGQVRPETKTTTLADTA